MISRVRAVRLALGIPLRRLAAQVGVGAPTLSRAERGQQPFYPALRKRVSAALGIDESRLFPAETRDGAGTGSGRAARPRGMSGGDE